MQGIQGRDLHALLNENKLKVFKSRLDLEDLNNEKKNA
jgi:hypothetical protein